MDQFRSKQTNPYSSHPRPTPSRDGFSVPRKPAPAAEPVPLGEPVPTPTPAPAPTPTVAPQPVAPAPAPTEPQAFVPLPPPPAPEPIAPAEPQPQPQAQPQPTPQVQVQQAQEIQQAQYAAPKAMDVVTRPAKKPIPKFVIVAPLALLFIAALSGAGFWAHKKQMASLQSQVESFKQETASLKSNKFGSTSGTGQGLSLSGAGSTSSGEGEVAGVSDDAEGSNGYAYTGQVALRDDQLLLEAFVNTKATGQIVEVWANYGGGENDLTKQTEKVTEGLSEETNGIVQMLATANLKDFEAGSSYMYQISAKAKDGKIYKTGYAVFTIPKQADTAKDNDSGL